MKSWLLILLLSSQAHAHCNQKIFDQLYAEVTTVRLTQSIEDLKRVNEGSWVKEQDSLVEVRTAPDFQILRDLCFGQQSTYEKWTGQ